MANEISGTIEYINAGSANYAIAASAYGYCTTLADQPAKTVNMAGFILNEGVTIHVKFQYNNTASNPTLNINNTGAKPIVQYGNVSAGIEDSTTGWYEGAVISFTYDGTSWVRDQGFNDHIEDITSDDIAPIATKIYTNVIATANDYAGAGFFYAKVRGNSYDEIWYTKVRVTVFIPSNTNYFSTSIYELWGVANTYSAYKCQNAIKNTSYRPVNYNTYFRINSSGYNEGLGAWLGFSLQSSHNPTNTSLIRVVKIELLEYNNCSVELQDSLITPNNIPDNTINGYYNSTSTNYDRFDFSNNGLRETGDDNTITVLQRSNNYLDNGSSLYLHGYAIFGLDANNKAQAISTYSNGYTNYTSNINIKGSRIYNSSGFDWTKGLYYSASSTSYAPSVVLNFSPYSSYSGFDFRYSDNVIASNTANNLGLINKKPIYLRGTIGNDGLFYLAPITVSYNNKEYERVWTQTIPSVENENGNYVYWFMGYPYNNNSYANSLYQAILYEDNKLYWYKDNQLKEYIPESVNSLKVNNHIILSDVPANAYFDENTWRPLGTGANEAAAGNHIHGNIQNNGTLQSTDVDITTNDKLVITDSSDDNKLARTALKFDTTKTNKWLSQKGEWSTPAPSQIGAISQQAELLTTNPFAPQSLRGPYISKIDNGFYAADKRWYVTATNLSSENTSTLFDGNYETQAKISGANAAVITIDFDPEHSNVTEKNKYFPGYPYGYILISFYSPAGPASISGRVYCNYQSQGIGWHNLTFSPISDNTSSNIVYRSEHQGYYNMAVLEITINGSTDNSYGYTSITQIEMHLDRPSSKLTPFLSKYGPETLYYDLTAPNFIGALQGTAAKATADASGNNIANTYLTKAAGVTNITWDSTNKKFVKTINGTNTDIVAGTTLINSILGTTTTTAKKFLKDTGNWAQVDWEDLTGKPSSETLRDQLFPLTTYTKTLTLTTAWSDTDIKGNDIPTEGSYIIQVFIHYTGTGSLSSYNEYYTGVMSWYATLTNSNDYDEIYLHKAGHASNGNNIYLRTIRESANINGNQTGRLKLQISANKDCTTEASIIFKFRKMI